MSLFLYSSNELRQGVDYQIHSNQWLFYYFCKIHIDYGIHSGTSIFVQFERIRTGGCWCIVKEMVMRGGTIWWWVCTRSRGGGGRTRWRKERSFIRRGNYCCKNNFKYEERGSFIICCCKNNWKSDQDRTFVMILDQTSKINNCCYKNNWMNFDNFGSIFGPSHIAVIIIVMLAHS